MYMSLTIHAKGFVCLTILRQFCIKEKERERVGETIRKLYRA